MDGQRQLLRAGERAPLITTTADDREARSGSLRRRLSALELRWEWEDAEDIDLRDPAR